MRDRKQRDELIFRQIEERRRIDQDRQRQEARSDERTFAQRQEQARAERLAAFKERRQQQAQNRPRTRDGPKVGR